jgi:hypothetical protein
MLRYVMGDTVLSRPGRFFKMLQQYGDSFRYGNAVTADYHRIAELASGMDLDWFFNEWVYQLGYPEYRLGWQSRQTADGWELTVELSQQNMSGAPECFHMPVEIRVTFAGGDTVIRYDVASNPQRNVFTLRAQPTGVEFDPNDWLLDEHTVQVGLQAGSPARPSAPWLAAGPNPGRGPVTFSYCLYDPGRFRLAVYDSQGRFLRRIASGAAEAGEHRVYWDRTDQCGRRLAAGVYIARLTCRGRETEVKLVLTD